MVRVVNQVYPSLSKSILIHWRLIWIKRMEWLVDNPGRTRTDLDKTEWDLAMSGHFKMDRMDGMVIIGQPSSKSTFGDNKTFISEQCSLSNGLKRSRSVDLMFFIVCLKRPI